MANETTNTRLIGHKMQTPRFDRQRSRNPAVMVVKIVFSAGLIAWLLATRVECDKVLVEFAGVHVGWLAAAASLHLTGLLISSLRWQVLLRAQDIRQSLGRLFSYYLVGHFFNMFLPTRVGGDLVRIYDTSRDHGSAVQPIAVVLVERISGMLTMLFMAAIVLLLRIDIGFDYMDRIPGVHIGILVFFLGLATVPLLLHPRLETLVTGMMNRCRVPVKLTIKIHAIFDAFRLYGKTPAALAAALGWGALLQINYIVHYWFLAKALGLGIPLAFFLVIIPIRTITLMLPFFINGIGLREFFDVTAFGFLGIGNHTAVAFSELAWLVQIVLAIFGGVYYALRRKRAQR
ncbi:flippase-like domain-containing protein [bacterium]|nr:flippase-like domain-containing protein [candidate division CSSED10-310 bacterium]